MAMGSIARFRCELAGFTGSPGLNTFHALDVGQAMPDQAGVDDFSDQLEAMYNSLKGFLTNNSTVAILPDVDIFDIETGQLQARMVVSTPWSVLCSGAATDVSRATQAKFRYRTDAIVGNRFLSGGIFFGPLAGQALDNGGGIDATLSSAVPTAHGGLLDVTGPMRLAVWAQPNDQGRVGAHGYVQSATCSTTPAVLRSRRD